MSPLSVEAWIWLSAADPPQLLPAREQMAFTLGFHIILVPFGVALTFIMMVANYRAIRHHDDVALRLAQRWSKVAAVLFAVGAVSGTVLSFELGLLWPELMGRFGPAFGIPFAIEGIFFFLEAIFIAIYIYGWNRLRPWTHFWTGLPVVLSGLGGTASVVAANAWMNLPAGFTMRNGRVVDVQPLDVIFNDAFGYETIHMFLAAYMVAGFVVASVYAVGMLRGRTDRYHRLGFVIPFAIAAIATPLQIVVGDIVARQVYDKEPVKFAAIEMLSRTSTHVPETIGGIYDDGGRVRYGLRIPNGASILAGFSPNTRIQGLNEVPPELRPEPHLVTLVHLAFDVMVFIGFALLGLSGWFGWAWWRRRELPKSRWFLRLSTLAGILAVIALEAGWVVTEVGRQPWTVVGYLLTGDAVTTRGNLWVVFAATLVIYAAVGTATILVLREMRRRWRASDARDDLSVPYGPQGPDEQPLEKAIPGADAP